MPRKKTFDLPEEAKAIFSAASARRRRQDTRCVVCGAELRAVLVTRRYCSGRCAVRAHRQRKSADQVSG